MEVVEVNRIEIVDVNSEKFSLSADKESGCVAFDDPECDNVIFSLYDWEEVLEFVSIIETLAERVFGRKPNLKT